MHNNRSNIFAHYPLVNHSAKQRRNSQTVGICSSLVLHRISTLSQYCVKISMKRISTNLLMAEEENLNKIVSTIIVDLYVNII